MTIFDITPGYLIYFQFTSTLGYVVLPGVWPLMSGHTFHMWWFCQLLLSKTPPVIYCSVGGYVNINVSSSVGGMDVDIMFFISHKS